MYICLYIYCRLFVTEIRQIYNFCIYFFNSPIIYNNPSRGNRHFRIEVVDVRADKKPNPDECLVFAELQNVNMATPWISMIMSFLVAVKIICGIETYGIFV